MTTRQDDRFDSFLERFYLLYPPIAGVAAFFLLRALTTFTTGEALGLALVIFGLVSIKAAIHRLPDRRWAAVLAALFTAAVILVAYWLRHR